MKKKDGGNYFTHLSRATLYILARTPLLNVAEHQRK